MDANSYAFIYTRQFIPFDQQSKEDLHKLDKFVIDYLCELEDRIRDDRKNKIETKQGIKDAEKAVLSLHRRLLEYFRQTEKNCYTCCSLHFCDYTSKHFDEFHKAVEEHRKIEQEDLHDHCCDQWKQAPSMHEIVSNMKKLFKESLKEAEDEKKFLEDHFPLENMLTETEQRAELNKLRTSGQADRICERPCKGDRVRVLFAFNDHRRKREFLQKDLTFRVLKVVDYKSKISEDRDNVILKLYSDTRKDSFTISASGSRWIITERNNNNQNK